MGHNLCYGIDKNIIFNINTQSHPRKKKEFASKLLPHILKEGYEINYMDENLDDDEEEKENSKENPAFSELKSFIIGNHDICLNKENENSLDYKIEKAMKMASELNTKFCDKRYSYNSSNNETCMKPGKNKSKNQSFMKLESESKKIQNLVMYNKRKVTNEINIVQNKNRYSKENKCIRESMKNSFNQAQLLASKIKIKEYEDKPESKVCIISLQEIIEAAKKMQR